MVFAFQSGDSRGVNFVKWGHRATFHGSVCSPNFFSNHARLDIVYNPEEEREIQRGSVRGSRSPIDKKFLVCKISGSLLKIVLVCL